MSRAVKDNRSIPSATVIPVLIYPDVREPGRHLRDGVRRRRARARACLAAQPGVTVSLLLTRRSSAAYASAPFRIPALPRFLLRWLQRPRAKERVGGVDLDSMSERELERLHSGLVRLASMDDTVLAVIVEQVLAGDELGSSS
jgi:hypothetical protein